MKYLGRLLAYDDEDTHAVRGNLKKTWRVWALISHVLRAENAPPWVCDMFYKATVQSVLLFGSETWCLVPTALESLECFHVKASCCMTGMLPRLTSGR